LVANPPATIRFYYKNFELRNQPPTIEIDDQSVNYSLLVHRQPQSGLYRIVAMNDQGMCAYETRVQAPEFADDQSAAAQLARRTASLSSREVTPVYQVSFYV
jgi:hypothetical protein